MDFNGPVASLVLGILLSAIGVNIIITGNGGNISYPLIGLSAPVVDWAGYVLAPIGIAISIVSIRMLMRGEGKRKPVKYTEEDAARAKEEMDSMYLKKYGFLPDDKNKEE